MLDPRAGSRAFSDRRLSRARSQREPGGQPRPGYRGPANALAAKGDYAGNSGDVAYSPTATLTGVIFWMSVIRAADISDGLSNTYLLGEKSLMPDSYEAGTSGGDDDTMYWAEVSGADQRGAAAGFDKRCHGVGDLRGTGQHTGRRNGQAAVGPERPRRRRLSDVQFGKATGADGQFAAGHLVLGLSFPGKVPGVWMVCTWG